jgi:hypothetical protein
MKRKTKSKKESSKRAEQLETAKSVPLIDQAVAEWIE